MQCVTPMFRLYNKEIPDKGGYIIARDKVLKELNFNPNYIRSQIKKFEAEHEGCGIQIIPCSNCWACRISYAAEWASRIMLEQEYYDHNYWITLTYDDDHVPKNETEALTLEPDDVTKFIKRIRKHMKDHKNHEGIKYFYCGEYGGQTFRPHYHIVFMNLPLDISEFYEPYVDPRFYKEHFKSHEIEQYWDKGMIEVTPLEWSNAAYTARYSMKKLHEESYLYDELKVHKEFVRMSNGIAKQYYIDHKNDIWITDSIPMKTVKGNLGRVKPPNYFLELLKKEDPEKARWILEKRKEAAERSRNNSYLLSDNTDLENLILQTEKIKLKANMLPREM